MVKLFETRRSQKCAPNQAQHPFPLGLAIRLIYIDAAQDAPRQASELPKVALSFAIQEPEVLGDASSTVI
ncbi:MAG: hypothetical protein H0U76_24365 [Ktedonobacteraceae bacterium]|nr:hypothetical protein [Ktedonobacteraceae bacterium]